MAEALASVAPEPPVLSKAPPRLHLEFLDGIRGIAALYVMQFHLITDRSVLPAWVQVLENKGPLFVCIFIVLSGFIFAWNAASCRDIPKQTAKRQSPPPFRPHPEAGRQVHAALGTAGSLLFHVQTSCPNKEMPSTNLTPETDRRGMTAK